MSCLSEIGLIFNFDISLVLTLLKNIKIKIAR